MMEVYEPDRLRITLICNPRGGISSKLVIDSDWKDRGGSERFKDYPERDEEWGILM
jgi:7-cyano-7-deazaguanine reductase